MLFYVNQIAAEVFQVKDFVKRRFDLMQVFLVLNERKPRSQRIHIRDDHEPALIDTAVVDWVVLIFFVNEIDDFLRRKPVEQTQIVIVCNKDISAVV